VPDAIKKGTRERPQAPRERQASRATPFPTTSSANYDGGKVLLKPATTGTASSPVGAVRAVLEAAGSRTSSRSRWVSSNHIAVVHATLNGLLKLRLAADITALRTTAGDAAKK